MYMCICTCILYMYVYKHDTIHPSPLSFLYLAGNRELVILIIMKISHYLVRVRLHRVFNLKYPVTQTIMVHVLYVYAYNTLLYRVGDERGRERGREVLVVMSSHR